MCHQRLPMEAGAAEELRVGSGSADGRWALGTEC
jgi:hypothetical protein